MKVCATCLTEWTEGQPHCASCGGATSTEVALGDLRELAKMLKNLDTFKRYNHALYWKPYPRQLDFFNAGATKRERLFMAGNQLGKTESAAFETAAHLTGLYPEWWDGKRFDHPVRGWCAGVSTVAVRDGPQKKLCGTPFVVADFGTGFIPKARFAAPPISARGIGGAFDTIQIFHSTDGLRDGVSSLVFKSFEMGREKFQGETLDFGWCDEEPEEAAKGLELYGEFLTRITGSGIMYMSYTPFKGLTPLTERLMLPTPDRSITTMELMDAAVTHLSADDKRKKLAGYEAHERDARARGIPMLGTGRVFPYSMENISFQMPQSIPPYWRKLWGIDFGIGHPFAAVLIAHDPESDTIYVLHAYRQADAMPLTHSDTMKRFAAQVPVAWPHDGTDREKSTGEPLASVYKKHGLLMLPEHATFEAGGYQTEPGILQMAQYMEGGRFKVAAHLSNWFEEFLFYHRKEGLIVKLKDDLMSATRIAVMARRFARAVPLGGKRPVDTQKFANDIDFDPF